MGITNSGDLDERDLAILRHVDQNLADALQLRRWWEKAHSTSSYRNQFQLVRTFHRPNCGVGFFDTVTLGGTPTPIMGLVQEMLYDRADSRAPSAIADLQKQFRQFVLGYLTHVTSFRQPEAYIEKSPSTSGPRKSNPLSWCPEEAPDRQGFGFSQLYYKLKGSGKLGKFPSDQQYAIVDLRELATKYEWIVAKVKIYAFDLRFQPFGSARPELIVPLDEETHVILSGDFISDRTSPGEEGSLGTYGLGYGMLHIDDRKSVLAYGPDHFDVGFQTIDFTMLPTGATSVRMVFVVNRPERLLRVPIRPFEWSFALADVFSLGLASKIFAPVKSMLQRISPDLGSFDPILTFVSLANAISAGQAAKQLCISREQLDKEMLLQHFMQHYQMILSSLLTWRFIENWLDKASLPRWVINGQSS